MRSDARVLVTTLLAAWLAAGAFAGDPAAPAQVATTSVGAVAPAASRPASQSSVGERGSTRPVFPLVSSRNRRYLIDQAGTPVAILGRASWNALSLAAPQYDAYLADTAAKGFNAVEVTAINHDPRGNNAPFAGNRTAPFLRRLDGAAWSGTLSYRYIGTEAPDFTSPNEAYWGFVDRFIDECARRGMLVLLFPAYVGYPDTPQGYVAEMVANGSARIQAYAAWVASRYRNRGNLVWMLGGDAGTGRDSFSSAQATIERALLAGLTGVADQQTRLYSAEWASASIATDQPDLGPFMTLNGAYSWQGATDTVGRRAYAASPTMPAFLLEEPYDEEGPDADNVNPNATQPVRRFVWWGWLSTIGGYIAGNGFVWPFRPGFARHLSTPGARELAVLNRFVSSIPWWKLVPSGLDRMRAIITVGGGSPGNTDYAAAAAAEDGSLIVAYVPPAHAGSVTVDLSILSGPADAVWINPADGASIAIGAVPNSGARSFDPPGNNGSGYSDWVLCIRVR